MSVTKILLEAGADALAIGDTITVDKPRTIVEIWQIRSTFGGQRQETVDEDPAEIAARVRDSNYKVQLKARLRSDQGITESDLFKPDSAFNFDINPKKIKNTLKNFKKTVNDAKTIKPIGIQIEHASVYGKKAELSFSDPNGTMFELLANGDIIYIYTYNEGQEHTFKEIQKTKASLNDFNFNSITGKGYNFKTTHTQYHRVTGDGKIENDFDEAHLYNLDFSGIITTKKQDIAGTQQCRINAIDPLKIFQHINVSTSRIPLSAHPEFKLNDKFAKDNNWDINDLHFMFTKAIYHCQYSHKDEFKWEDGGDLYAFKPSFKRQQVKYDWDSHYADKITLYEVRANDYEENKITRKNLHHQIFLAHPVTLMKALMLYLNDQTEVMSTLDIQVIYTKAYKQMFNTHMKDLIQNIEFGEGERRLDGEDGFSWIGGELAKSQIDKYYKQIAFPDVLIGVCFYGNLIGNVAKMGTGFVKDINEYSTRVSHIAFTFGAGSGLDDRETFSKLQANILNLHINPNPKKFDYNTIIHIMKNFFVKREASLAGVFNIRAEDNRGYFKILLDQYNSDWIGLIGTNPLAVRSSKFSSKDTVAGKGNEAKRSIPIPQLLQYAFGWFNQEPYYYYPFDTTNKKSDRRERSSNLMYDMSQSTWIQSDIVLFKDRLVDVATGQKMARAVFFPLASTAYSNKFKLGVDNETYVKYIPASKILEMEFQTMSSNNHILMIKNDESSGQGLYENADRVYNRYPADIVYFVKENRTSFEEKFDDGIRELSMETQLFQENIVARKDLPMRRRLTPFFKTQYPLEPEHHTVHGYNTGNWFTNQVDTQNSAQPMEMNEFVEDDNVTLEDVYTDTKISRIVVDENPFLGWVGIKFDKNVNYYDPHLINPFDFKGRGFKPPFELEVVFENASFKEMWRFDTLFGAINNGVDVNDIRTYIDSKFANLPEAIYNNIYILSNYDFNKDPLKNAVRPDVDFRKPFTLNRMREFMLDSMKSVYKAMKFLPYDITIVPERFTDSEIGSDLRDVIGNSLDKTADFSHKPMYNALKKLLTGFLIKGDEIYDYVGGKEVFNMEKDGETVTIRIILKRDELKGDGVAANLADNFAPIAKNFSYVDHVNIVNQVMSSLTGIEMFLKNIMSRSVMAGKLYLPNFGKEKIRIGQELNLIDDRIRTDVGYRATKSIFEDGAFGEIRKATLGALIRTLRGSVVGLKLIQDTLREMAEIDQTIDSGVGDDKDSIFTLSLRGRGARANPFYVWKTVTYLGQSSSGESSTSGYTQKVYLSDNSVLWNNQFEEDDFTSKLAEALIGRGFPLIEPSVFED